MPELVPELIFLVVVALGLVCGLVYAHRQAEQPRGPRQAAADPAVDDTPLPGYVRRNWLANFSPRTLVPRGPACLELRFGTGAKIGGAISLAVGFWLCTMVFTMLQEGPGGGGLWYMVLLHGAGGVAFALSGLYLILDLGRTAFDRAAGLWTEHHVLVSATRPLEEILAIQLISGGMQKSEGGDYETFQVNLVLNDSAQPRQNLLEHHELSDTRTVARQLAEFLQVPLLDLTAANAANPPVAQ